MCKQLLSGVLLLFLLSTWAGAEVNQFDKKRMTRPPHKSSIAVTGVFQGDDIEVAVNDFGQFTMGKVNGPILLYGHPRPGTSYTSFSIDGTTITNTVAAYRTSGPATQGLMNTTTWTINGKFRVIQYLTIVKGSSSGKYDNCEIRYEVTNIDNTSHNFGLRLMMDTMLGGNDGAPFRFPGTGAVTKEREWLAASIPPYYQAFDNLAAPTIQSQGTILGANATRPDRVIAAYWGDIWGAVWNYPVDTNKVLTNDSAIGIYWYPVSMISGETRTFVTYYGLGEIEVDVRPPLVAGLSAPKSIALINGYSAANPFALSVYLSNSTQGVTATAAGITTALSLPEFLTLVPGENAVKIIPDLPVNADYQTVYNITISRAASGKKDYSMTVNANSIGNKILTKQIYVFNIATSPVNDEVIPVGLRPITAAFNVPMDASNFTGASMQVLKETGGSIAGTVSYNQSAKTASFVPSAPWEQGKRYVVQIVPPVQSADSVMLPHVITWNFAVESAAPPTLILSFDSIDDAAFPAIHNFVTVIDSSSRPILGLASADFEVRETGVFESPISLSLPDSAQKNKYKISYATHNQAKDGALRSVQVKVRYNNLIDIKSKSYTAPREDTAETKGQTIITGTVLVNSSFASEGTTLRFHNKRNGLLAASTAILPLSSGKNFMTSILSGDGGVMHGDTLLPAAADSIGNIFTPRFTAAPVHVAFDSAFPPAFKVVTLFLAAPRTVSMPLVQGYNAVSWNVKPASDSVKNVFSTLFQTGKVQVVLGFTSNIDPPQFTYYLPDFGPYNPMQMTDFRNGYFVRLKKNMQPDSLVVSGMPVMPTEPVSLNKGYNFISYLPEKTDTLTNALASIAGNYSTVLDYRNTGTGLPGSEYFNASPASVASMMAGKGYFVFITAAADTLIYPGIGYVPAGIPQFASSQMSGCSVSVPQMMVAYGLDVKNGSALAAAGSKLQAVGAGGALYGEAVFAEDGVVSIMIAGDDPLTPEKEGAALNESIRLRLNGAFVPLQIRWTGFGDTPVLDQLADVTIAAEEPIAPKAFMLHPNYPNPFNPSTAIQYEIAGTSHTALIVYTSLGEEVATLVNEEKTAGRYTAAWNGRNKHNQPAASGIYFVKMKAGRYTAVQKMMLLK